MSDVKKRFKRVYAEMSSLLKSFYEVENLEDINYDSLLQCPYSGDWPLEVVQFAKKCVQTMVDELSPLDSELYEGVGGGVTKEGKKRQIPNVSIYYNDNISSEYGKVSVLLPYQGPKRIRIAVDSSIQKSIEDNDYRFGVLIAIIFHEIGHIVLKGNTLSRYYGSGEDAWDPRSSLENNLEEERDAWVFSHEIRALARSTMTILPRESPTLSKFG